MTIMSCPRDLSVFFSILSSIRHKISIKLTYRTEGQIIICSEISFHVSLSSSSGQAVMATCYFLNSYLHSLLRSLAVNLNLLNMDNALHIIWEINIVFFLSSVVSVMRSHVSGQVVPLSEVFVADRAGEFLLPSPPHLGLRSELLLMMRTHVENEVRGHAEGQVAFGAPVLHRHAERGESRWEDRERRGCL